MENEDSTRVTRVRVTDLIPSYQAIVLVASALLVGSAVAFALRAWAPLPWWLDAILSGDLIVGAFVLGLVAGLAGFFMFLATRLGITASGPSKLRELESSIELKFKEFSDKLSAVELAQRSNVSDGVLNETLAKVASAYF